MKFLFLSFGLFDNSVQFLDLSMVVSDTLFFFSNIFNKLFDLLLLFFNLLVFFLMLVMLSQQLPFLRINLFFQLRNLMVNHFIPSFILFILFLNISQIFRDHISIGTHSLIQRLLLFEFSFGFVVLFLKFGDKVISQFDLVAGIEVFCLGSGGLQGI